MEKCFYQFCEHNQHDEAVWYYGKHITDDECPIKHKYRVATCANSYDVDKPGAVNPKSILHLIFSMLTPRRFPCERFRGHSHP